MNTVDARKIGNVCCQLMKWLQARKDAHKDTSFYEQIDVVSEVLTKVLTYDAPEKITSLHFVKANMELQDTFEQIKFEMGIAKMVDGDISRRYDNDPIFRKRFDKMMVGREE